MLRSRRALASLLLLAGTPAAGQAQPDYLPFDPARIGLPALTETGRDYLIEQHRQLIEEARRNIREITDGDFSDAEARIARYEQLILEEFRQIARLSAARVQEASAIAAAGDVKDLSRLKELVTTVLEASRFNALAGNEEEALAQYRSAVEVLRAFSASFATTCYDQEFDQVIAVGLERQNEMLGTGIDVLACARRLFVAEGREAHVTWEFKHCGFGVGEWKFTASGPNYQARGLGTIEGSLTGDVAMEVSTEGLVAQYTGELRLTTKPLPKAEEVAQPDQLVVDINYVAGVHDDSVVTSNMSSQQRLMLPVKKSDKPCRDAEERSSCPGPGCNTMSRADLFVRTFASASNPQGLRTTQLEPDEEVRLAFYGIDAARVEVETAKLTPQEGEIIIDGFEDTIRSYVHDQTANAIAIARSGRAADLPALRTFVGGLLGVARQDAFIGREALAQQAQVEMLEILEVFSQEFANSCDQQDFPVETALALERQNKLLGSGIALMHCSRRKLSAELSHQGVTYRFETCSGPLHLTDRWDLTLSGRLVGKGEVNGGLWEAQFLWNGHDVQMGGFISFFTREVETDEMSVTVSENAGPNAEPNDWVSAPIPDATVYPNRVYSTLATSGFEFFPGGFHGTMEKVGEAEVKMGEPCSA